MAWKGIKHKAVGDEMTRPEFESEEAHEIQNGETLPPTGNNDGDFYFKTDEHRLYIYIEEA